MAKHKVATVDQIVERNCQLIQVADKELILIKLDGQIYAMDNLCSHADASLCDGEIDGDEIICPLHFARFNIKNGAVTEPPAIDDQKVYAVEVIDNEVYVEI